MKNVKYSVKITKDSRETILPKKKSRIFNRLGGRARSGIKQVDKESRLAR